MDLMCSSSWHGFSFVRFCLPPFVISLSFAAILFLCRNQNSRASSLSRISRCSFAHSIVSFIAFISLLLLLFACFFGYALNLSNIFIDLGQTTHFNPKNRPFRYFIHTHTHIQYRAIYVDAFPLGKC